MNYSLLYQQIDSLTKSESDLIANLANTSAVLFDALDNINWCGFYMAKEDALVLGPFQGKPACVNIKKGHGVCGTAMKLCETQVVDDVHSFEGHIACDTASESEIVIPIVVEAQVMAVLDIDSPVKSRFASEDKTGLEAIAQLTRRFWQ
ncbi:MAG: GAF domain-containing protein [Pseudomonadota bacterium]